MSGRPWFRFFPRDWISGTRGLSDRARGAYIDLLARMYDLGRQLDYDERDLCRFLGYRDKQQLGPVIKELIDAGKIIVEDGKLSNERFQREMAAMDQATSNGKKGGRPAKQMDQGHPPGAIPGTPPGTQPRGTSSEENQVISRNPPEPEPESKNSIGKAYRFEGKAIRLNEADFAKWQSRYHAIADLEAELWGLDDWWDREHPTGNSSRPDWWHAVPRALNKKHQQLIAETKARGTQASNDADSAAYDREFEAARGDSKKMAAFIAKWKGADAKTAGGARARG